MRSLSVSSIRLFDRCPAAFKFHYLDGLHEEATEPVEAAVTDSEHVIYWRGGWVQASVYARERLQPGHELPGPAVVEQEDSTTLIHPGFRARVDRFLNLILERA